MTQFFLCLLALLFSVSGPEIERNAEFWHSRFAAKSGRATWNEFQAATRGQFATPEQAWTRTGRKASVLTKTARRQPTAPKTQLSLPAPKQPVALLPEAAESLAARGEVAALTKFYPIFFFSFDVSALPTTGYSSFGFHQNGYIAQSFTPNRSKIRC